MLSLWSLQAEDEFKAVPPCVCMWWSMDLYIRITEQKLFSKS